MYASAPMALSSIRRPSWRRFVAMDIENINGGAVKSRALAEAAWRQVAEAIGLGDDELVVVGAGPSSLLAAGISHPSARLVLGHGINGADSALIEVLHDEHLADRFDEIVIASGDGIFTDVTAALAFSGAKVTVVARDGHLSKRLRLAAGEVVLLPDFAPQFGRAA